MSLFQLNYRLKIYRHYKYRVLYSLSKNLLKNLLKNKKINTKYYLLHQMKNYNDDIQMNLVYME